LNKSIGEKRKRKKINFYGSFTVHVPKSSKCLLVNSITRRILIHCGCSQRYWSTSSSWTRWVGVEFA